MNAFSIILPVRNGGNYVKQCVQSILTQQYEHFNLIILENGSTDGTAQWLTTLHDSRIQVYPAEQSLNIAENWSRIVHINKNEFVTIIGHDDLLLPHYLEEMDALIQKHPAATLYQSHFDFIDANGAKMRTCLPMDETQYAHELLASLLANTLDSMGSGYMFRAADYNALGGMPANYPDLLFADNELWIKLTSLGYKATTQRNCFAYRLHQSLSRTTGGMNYYQSFSQYILFLSKLIDHDSRMRDAVARYGYSKLNEYTEAVAHRLLKTPVEKRTISVRQFIEQCRQYAEWLIPGQNFEPLRNKRVRLAEKLDSNPIARTTFQTFRKLYSGKL